MDWTDTRGWSALSCDLRIAVGEVQQGWSSAIARNGIVLGRENGRGLRPALTLVRGHIAPGSGSLGANSETVPCAFADKVLGLAAFRSDSDYQFYLATWSG